MGTKQVRLVRKSSDTIQICGLKNQDGEPSYFESDAYHLASYCVENGLEMIVIEDIYDFDELWKD